MYFGCLLYLTLFECGIKCKTLKSVPFHYEEARINLPVEREREGERVIDLHVHCTCCIHAYNVQVTIAMPNPKFSAKSTLKNSYLTEYK